MTFITNVLVYFIYTLGDFLDSMSDDLDDKDRKEYRRKKIEKNKDKKEFSEEYRFIKKSKQEFKNRLSQMKEEELWSDWEEDE